MYYLPCGLCTVLIILRCQVPWTIPPQVPGSFVPPKSSCVAWLLSVVLCVVQIWVQSLNFWDVFCQNGWHSIWEGAGNDGESQTHMIKAVQLTSHQNSQCLGTPRPVFGEMPLNPKNRHTFFTKNLLLLHVWMW